MPFQPNFLPLSNFLTKYTPAKSVQSLYFPSSTTSNEFLKFLVTLKRLKTRLLHIHLTGKQITCTNLSAIESLLGKWTETLILDSPSSKVDIAHISPLIAASPRLKSFAIETCCKFSSGEYHAFLKDLVRAGETSRLHHLHPEINARLRSLQISCSTIHTVNFSFLAELGRYFPLLELLRIENWRILVDKKLPEITPMYSLRGLSLVGIDVIESKKAKTNVFARMLATYIRTFPALEILVLGAREMDVLGWKLFVRKPELGAVFNGMELPRLKVLWLRAWVVNCSDLLSLRSDTVEWVIVEACRGLNGGWVKAVEEKWKKAVIFETDTRLTNVHHVFAWEGLGPRK
jgi:hypothetical protein